MKTIANDYSELNGIINEYLNQDPIKPLLVCFRGLNSSIEDYKKNYIDSNNSVLVFSSAVTPLDPRTAPSLLFPVGYDEQRHRLLCYFEYGAIQESVLVYCCKLVEAGKHSAYFVENIDSNDENKFDGFYRVDYIQSITSY